MPKGKSEKSGYRQTPEEKGGPKPLHRESKAVDTLVSIDDLYSLVSSGIISLNSAAGEALDLVKDATGVRLVTKKSRRHPADFYSKH